MSEEKVLSSILHTAELDDVEETKTFDTKYQNNKDSFNKKYDQLLQISDDQFQDAVSRNKVVKLRQRDFKKGSYLITKPGVYQFVENIVFNPNSRYTYLNSGRIDTGLDWMPTPKQLVSGGGKYNDKAFRFGFFGAIVVMATNVIIDLNGFTLLQHQEHALQQRFYSHIDLSSAPFPKDAGPAMFTDGLSNSSYIVIRNGTLARSSHHSIHGNKTLNIIIEDMTIEDFEIAGISLNAASNVMVKNVTVGDNRKDVPVTAIYSSARFIRLFVKRIIAEIGDATIAAEGQAKLDALQAIMDQAFNQIIGFNGQIESGSTNTMFRNDRRINDGNSFGILLHGEFSVLEFDNGPNGGQANDIYLKDVTVKNLHSQVQEIPGLNNTDSNGVLNGPSGSVLQILNLVDNNGRYVGTPVSEMKLYVAKYGSTSFQLGRSNIGSDIIDWSENGTDIADVIAASGYLKFVCNGDAMHHVNKGVIAVKLDGCNRVIVENLRVSNIVSVARLGSEVCGPYQTSHTGQGIGEGASNNNTRAVSFAGCQEVVIKGCTIDSIHSNNGNSTGMDIFQKSNNFEGKGIRISNVTAGSFQTVNGLKIWRGEAFDGAEVPYTTDLPNLIPKHCALRICDDCSGIRLYNVQVSGDNYSPGNPGDTQVDGTFSIIN